MWGGGVYPWIKWVDVKSLPTRYSIVSQRGGNTLLGTHISQSNITCEDNFSFPKVGYVFFFSEGILMHLLRLKARL